MNRDAWKDSLEGVGLLALIASLLFLSLQVRQDHKIARAELDTVLSERAAGLLEMKTSAEFSKTWAKMLEQPDELSTAEVIRLNSFLLSVREVFFIDCLLLARGIFDECEAYARSHIPLYFGNKYAKAWWARNPAGGQLEWLNAVVSETDAGWELRSISESMATK
jgi:hypothetical protein